MPFIKINEHELEVPTGTTVLEAAKTIGLEIPHYCYHPAMRIVASCRMCLVKIQGMPKLVPSCSTRINEMPAERKVDGKYDMVVITNDADVVEAQESVLEFLLLNHPVDCPECDQAGECLLQDYSYRYGKDHSRFEFSKRVPRRKDLGPQILLISTRCILCSRCIRFTEEITGTRELIVKNRGYQSEIDVFPGMSLNNKLSMCTADVCPVGALVTKDFLFKPRNWNYQKVRTICPGCSVGCNVVIEYKEEDNQIYRIKPEYNAEVNQWWACDEGRLLYHKFRKLERLEYPMIRKGAKLRRTNWRQAFRVAREKLTLFSADQLAAVGNGYATNEENFLLQELFRKGLQCDHIAIYDQFHRQHDVVYPKFTIKGEKLPNYQGAQDMLKAPLTFTRLLDKIRSGEISALYFLGGDPNFTLNERDIETLKKLDFLIVQDIAWTPLAQLADVVFAGASVYEKEGTYTNYRNRVQRIRPVILPPGIARSDHEIIQELCGMFDLPRRLRPSDTFTEIVQCRQGYQEMSYESLGELGIFIGQAVAELEAVK